jgi:hypothetical protein
MFDLFFSDHAAWFAVPALIGTAFFTLRLVLMMLGLHHGGDLSVDVGHGDVHAPSGGGVDHDTDSSDAFRILSIQSIAAFAMGFGWGGLGGFRGADWTFAVSTVFGLGTGIGMWWLLALLLKALFDLQSSGTTAAEDTIGAEGDVYANIPEHGSGRGQVRVTVADRQRIYNAISSGEALPSQTRIRVINVNEDNTLTVTPA